MIVLFTDFGRSGPYVGQMHIVLAQRAPQVPVIDLFHEVPAFDIRAAAYLLPAYVRECGPGTIIVGVVDPSVGGARRAVIVEADGRTYVGPDNGLFEIVVRRAASVRCRTLDWRPLSLSSTFHGRDLFAPAAAMLALQEAPAGVPTTLTPLSTRWSDDLAEILYIDAYGNAISGMRAASLPADARVCVRGQRLSRQATFEKVVPGSAFWYENSNGLLEIAVNRGRADTVLGLRLGDPIAIEA